MDLLWLVAHTAQECPNSMKYLQLSDAEKQEKPSGVRPSIRHRRALTERRGRSDVTIIIITINDIISISFIIIIAIKIAGPERPVKQSVSSSVPISITLPAFECLDLSVTQKPNWPSAVMALWWLLVLQLGAHCWNPELLPFKCSQF